MRHYCTLFDWNYLPRGLALHRSLLRHGGDFTLHVLCLDEATQATLGKLALERVELISIAGLEAGDGELRRVRPGRSAVEFYFTCKPVLLACLLARHPQAERITYLDSDLYFFSDAAAGESELAGNPIALSPHAFTAHNAHYARFGLFNAGWLSIDTSAEARRFVSWWRERCLEWCSLTVEETRFGDQKYLDRVPQLFPGTAQAHRGINAGPWNLDPSELRLSGNGIMVSGRPLVAFHFHALRRVLFGLYDCTLDGYGIKLTRHIRKGIYRPYLKEMAACARAARRAPRLGEPASPPQITLARQMRQTVRALVRGTALFAG